MYKIRIENFIKTARIGPVENGLSQEQVINMLGNPEWEISTIMKYPIYKYGCLEIGFNDSGKVYVMGIKFPYNGKKTAKVNGTVEIENFMSIKRMNIRAFERFLSRQGVDYYVDESRCNETYHCMVLTKKVEVFFLKQPEKPYSISTC